jgi:hypothetical protein
MAAADAANAARLGLDNTQATNKYSTLPAMILAEEIKRLEALQKSSSKGSPASFRIGEELSMARLAAQGNSATTAKTPTSTPTPTWVKVGTVQTANGPVDVDASGKAVDGSTPVAVTKPSGLGTGNLTGEQVDAIAGLGALLTSYGIGGLNDAITNAVIKGYSRDTIKLIMQDPNSTDPLAVAFQKRFPANKERLAAGKPVLSPGEYLAAERSYAQVFQSYGLGNMAKPDNFNKFIAGDVSAAEVSDRVSLAVNRVQNADPFVKQALGQFYPMLNQGDIVNAMLNPEDGLPALQRKVQISEIGGASLAQNLTTSLNALDTRTNFANVMGGTMGASELAALGITKEQARAGYANVAEVLPRSEFLSAITGGEDYTQKQAEQEQFQGLASAKRAREALAGAERGRFGGSSGTAGTRSFGTQTKGAI